MGFELTPLRHGASKSEKQTPTLTTTTTTAAAAAAAAAMEEEEEEEEEKEEEEEEEEAAASAAPGRVLSWLEPPWTRSGGGCVSKRRTTGCTRSTRSAWR